MTNALYIALTFKLRTLSSPERAAQTRAIEREDLEKSMAQVVDSADVDLRLPFAERLWSEPVWEFNVAALKTLALEHVSTSPERWVFRKGHRGSSGRAADGVHLGHHFAEIPP